MRNVWFPSLVIAGSFLLSAHCAQAISYVRGNVAVSGQGTVFDFPCPATSDLGAPCYAAMDSGAGYTIFETGLYETIFPNPTPQLVNPSFFDVFSVPAITPNSSWEFLFSSPVNIPNNSQFGAVGCGPGNPTAMVSGSPLTVPCMANQDPSSGPGFGFIIDETGVTDGFILTFGPNAPPDWVFAVAADSSAPSQFLPTSIQQIPEPGSMTLLAAGLLGLGALRRKRAA